MRKILDFFHDVYELFMVLLDIFFDEENSISSFVLTSECIFCWVGVCIYHEKSASIGWIGGRKGYLLMFVLYFLIAVMIVKVIGIGNRRRYKVLAHIYGVFAPYGLLKVIFYKGIWGYIDLKFLFGSSLLVALICLFVQIASLLIRKRGRRLKSLRRTSSRVLHTMFCYGITAVLVLCVFISIEDAFETLGRSKRQKAYMQEIISETDYIIDNNAPVLKNFTEENWSALSYREKEKALYELAQLEALFMTGKTDSRIIVAIGADYSSAAAFYNGDNNMILIDEQYINDVSFMVESICHEMHHYLVHTVLEEGRELDVNHILEVNRFPEYEYNFAHNINIDSDFDSYYKQAIEVDARDYTEKRARMYLGYINGRFCENENSDKGK